MINMGRNSIWEWIWPRARLDRIERELDADERINVAQMWHKLQESQLKGE